MQPPDEGGFDEVGIDMELDKSNHYVIFTANGNVFFRQRAQNVDDESMVQFDPLRHRQLRIRSDGAMVHFETSDGSTWVEHKTVATVVPLTSIKATLYGGAYLPAGPVTTAVFDNFVISGRCPSM